MLLFVVTFAWSRRLKKTNKRTVLLGYRDECSEVSLMWKMIGLLLASVAVIQWQCRLRSLVVTSSFCYFFLCNLLSSKCPIVSYLVCGLRECLSRSHQRRWTRPPTLFSSMLAANQAPSSMLGTCPQCYTIHTLSMSQCSEENEKNTTLLFCRPRL